MFDTKYLHKGPYPRDEFELENNPYENLMLSYEKMKKSIFRLGIHIILFFQTFFFLDILLSQNLYYIEKLVKKSLLTLESSTDQYLRFFGNFLP